MRENHADEQQMTAETYADSNWNWGAWGPWDPAFGNSVMEGAGNDCHRSQQQPENNGDDREIRSIALHPDLAYANDERKPRAIGCAVWTRHAWISPDFTDSDNVLVAGLTERWGLTLGRSLTVMALLALMSPGRAGTPITIINDNTGTVLATLTDMNVNPPVTIISAQPINGFASISLDVPTDSDGNAHIGWSASNTDEFDHRCGSGSRIVKPGETLHVRADHECRSQ
jgi:hypothetical protein